MTSRIDVIAATLADIAAMREVYRQEMGCQIVHDSWHARRFTELFRLQIDGRDVGYGAVGGAPGEPRELVKELYLVPSARPLADALFTRLVEMSGAHAIEAQTNDPLLSEMLDAHAALVTSETVLFEAASTPVSLRLTSRSGRFDRPRRPAFSRIATSRWAIGVSSATAPSWRRAGCCSTTTLPLPTSTWRWSRRIAVAATVPTWCRP